MSILVPKRVKYRKAQRGRRKGAAQRGNKLSYGEYGLQVLENGWVTNVQLEAARVAISRSGATSKVYIRAFPDKPVSKKPAETRMGKGKGAVDHYVSVVRPGTIMFEMDGIPAASAKEALEAAAYKLPIKCKFVSRA
jgi:large subunit ribosomal protein L16